MTPAEDWERIAFEVAMNHCGPKLQPTDLIMELGLTEPEFEELCDDDLFKRKVKEYTKELTANGTSFALKAQLQAEELLKTQFRIAKDKDTPPSVAIAAIQSVVRWAGYDKRPGDTQSDAAASGPKVSISINLSATRTPTITTTTKEALTVDEEGKILPSVEGI